MKFEAWCGVYGGADILGAEATEIVEGIGMHAKASRRVTFVALL